jgi:hypothetical protein
MGEAKRRGTFEQRKAGSKLNKRRRLSVPKVGREMWPIEARRELKRISPKRIARIDSERTTDG